jgi:NAD(P)H-hydrate repair Nnr-like enzyme with NAD(P)H-hydrate epimerase domain
MYGLVDQTNNASSRIRIVIPSGHHEHSIIKADIAAYKTLAMRDMKPFLVRSKAQPGWKMEQYTHKHLSNAPRF